MSNLPDINNVRCSPPIAGDGEVAGLGVEGEQLEVHGAAQSERHLQSNTVSGQL